MKNEDAERQAIGVPLFCSASTCAAKTRKEGWAFVKPRFDCSYKQKMQLFLYSEGYYFDEARFTIQLLVEQPGWRAAALWAIADGS
jgi:hypothetical protein